jgi:hypothetical protein
MWGKPWHVSRNGAEHTRVLLRRIFGQKIIGAAVLCCQTVILWIFSVKDETISKSFTVGGSAHLWKNAEFLLVAALFTFITISEVFEDVREMITANPSTLGLVLVLFVNLPLQIVFSVNVIWMQHDIPGIVNNFLAAGVVFKLHNHVAKIMNVQRIANAHHLEPLLVLLFGFLSRLPCI